MGTIGSGNFDSDTAADHLGSICDGLIRDIESAMKDRKKIEPDEYWGVAVPCNIELLVLFRKSGYFGSRLPDRETAVRWRDVYLSVWDSKASSLLPDESERAERLSVLKKTFSSLIRLLGTESP